MNKNILLIEGNLRFSQNLQQYFQAQDALVNVDIVTNVDNCRTIKKEQLDSYKIILTSPNIYHELKDILTDKLVILLYAGEIPAEYQDFHKISKLVTLDEIYQDVMNIYAKTKNLIMVSKDKKTKIISFYSPIGGCGKTSMSLLVANLLSEMGKRVLYLPLEDFNDRRLLYGASTTSATMEQLFTGIDMTAEIRYEMNNIVAKNPQTNLNYLVGLESPEDNQVVQEESWIELLNLLQKETNYEYIILDLSINEAFTKRHWIESSDYVFCVAAKGYMEGLIFSKGMNYFRYRYPHQTELYCIVNSAKHSGSKSTIDTSGFKEACELSYDSHIKTVMGEEVVFSMESGVAGYLRNFLYSVIGRQNIHG